MRVFYKLRLFLGFLVCLCLANTALATSNRILVLGDSISAAYGMDTNDGWVALLQGKLTAENFSYEVINASITGDVSASGAQRISALLAEYQPEWIIIELGGNDGLRGLPLNHLRENLADMIRKSQQADAKVMLAGMQIFPNYGPRYATGFKNMYAELSEQYETDLIPFILEGVGGNPRYIQADGIHPNVDAQAVLLVNVWVVLAPLLSKA